MDTPGHKPVLARTRQNTPEQELPDRTAAGAGAGAEARSLFD